jgi:acyl carrier protein
VTGTMTMSDLSTRRIGTDAALAWLAELFEAPADSLSPDTPRDAIATWDSLGQLLLMSALDERFGIRLSQGEANGLRAVGDVLGLLRRHGCLDNGDLR